MRTESEAARRGECCPGSGRKAVSFHEALEGGAVDPERLRGSAHVSAVLLEGPPEKLSLQPFKDLRFPCPIAIAVCAAGVSQDRLWEVLRGNEGSLRIT